VAVACGVYFVTRYLQLLFQPASEKTSRSAGRLDRVISMDGARVSEGLPGPYGP
jgi:hypothetical protein